jgi:UDP-2,3-diacylglucosamine hydrolase
MSGRNLAFVGDVHLERDDAALGPFLAFLARLGRTSERIVLLGDLFDLWIGEPGLEQAQHAAVIERLSELRRAGVRVRYVEGNRDYGVVERHGGRAIERGGQTAIVETFAGRRYHVAHGDLVNRADRQYRLWRRISRAAPVWWLFRRVPPGRRRRLAAALEARMRRSNPSFKRQFPEAEVRAFAAPLFDAGVDFVVLGHFHVERDLAGAAGRGRILVLPEWKGSRRHLEARPSGELAFVDSE